MPYCRSPRFFLSRLRNGANYLIGSSRGSDSEPISKAIAPLSPLPQPSGLQNDIFSEKVFAPRFLPPPPYRNIESRKTTRFFKKSSYYITEACTPQKTTSNFVFLKTFSTIWTTTLKGLKTTANCSFFKKSLYSLTATSNGVFSIPDSKKISNITHPLTATSEAEKRHHFSKPTPFSNFMRHRA